MVRDVGLGLLDLLVGANGCCEGGAVAGLFQQNQLGSAGVNRCREGDSLCSVLQRL